MANGDVIKCHKFLPWHFQTFKCEIVSAPSSLQLSVCFFPTAVLWSAICQVILVFPFGFCSETGSCSAAFQCPEQTNKRSAESVCFCSHNTAFLHSLFILERVGVCVFVWIEVVAVDISVVLNAVIVYDLWIVKGCVYTLRSRTHTLTHQWQQAVIHTVQHPFISHTPSVRGCFCLYAHI